MHTNENETIGEVVGVKERMEAVAVEETMEVAVRVPFKSRLLPVLFYISVYFIIIILIVYYVQINLQNVKRDFEK